jgi:hypothetical protein
MENNAHIEVLILRQIGYLLICFFLVFLFVGCSKQLPVVHKLSSLPGEGICRVAILPFINESDFPQGDTIFYRVFTSEMPRYEHFELIQEGDVREAFRKARVAPGLKELDLENLRIIGNYLNADVLIEGTIIELDEYNNRGSVVPFMSLNIQLIDAPTGRLLWSTYHRREGEEYRKIMHFGMVNTTTRLARRISEEIIKRWLTEGLVLKCTD